MALDLGPLVGTWKLDRDEKFDEYLSELGLGVIKRKMAGTIKPTIHIETVDGKVKVSTSGGPRSVTSEFELGQEFKSTDNAMGESMCIVARFTDCVLEMEVKPENPSKGKIQTIQRQVINDEMVQTMKVGNVECKRYFKRQ